MYRSSKIFTGNKRRCRIPRKLLSLILQRVKLKSKHSTRLTPENPLSLLKTFVFPFENKRQNWFQNSGMVQESSGSPSTPKAGHCQSLKGIIHIKKAPIRRSFRVQNTPSVKLLFFLLIISPYQFQMQSTQFNLLIQQRPLQVLICLQCE